MLKGLAKDPDGHALTIFAHREAEHVVSDLAPAAELRLLDWRHNRGSIRDKLDPRAHDVLLCPQMGLDPPDPQIPAAAVVPDLIPRLVPQYFSRRARRERERLMSDTMAGATLVLTASEFSRSAILDSYPIAPSRVLATPCAVDEEFLRPPAECSAHMLAGLELPERYVIFPANYWPHKNHAGAIAAFELLARERPALSLVLTGAASKDAERVRALIGSRRLADRIRMVPFQPKAILVEMMRRAEALLFPTHMEGFGIPILEAFELGVPVVASGAGATAEVAGDAALIVNPDSARDIADGVLRVLDDEQLRRELVRRGRGRAAAYSWERTVTKVIAALRSIA